MDNEASNDQTDPRNIEDLTPEQIDKAVKDGDLDPAAELAKYAEALRQEYEIKIAETPDNVQEHTKDFFQKVAHTAAAQIVFLADHAESETVRLNANKFILTQAFADEETEKDPLKALLAGLTKNDKEQVIPNTETTG